MQRHASRREAATRLCIVNAVDQAHKLAHHVHVIPGRPKGILRHQPAIGKDHEINVCSPRCLRRGSKYGENGWVCMVEKQRPYWRKTTQIILIGRVVAVPGDHVQRGMLYLRGPKHAIPFHHQGPWSIMIFIGRNGSQKVARIRQAISAYRPAFGQTECCAIVFANVSTGGSAQQLDTNLHPARNDANLSGNHVNCPKFGTEP